MFAITHLEVTSEILDLFDFSNPTMSRAFNVLEGIARGAILIDDPSLPTWGVVRDATYGTLYFGGQINASLLVSLVEHFRKIGDVGIGCWPDDPLNEMIPPNPDYDGRTLYFTERLPDHPSRSYELPAGYRLVPRDEQLFSKSFDYEATLASFGTIENVMKHTLGVVILQGDIIICEAGTGAPTRGLIEVGVTTAEAYRGQRFATIACVRLIELCEAQGYHTWWDCAKQNIPSVELARKLGYHDEQEYRYVWWAKSK